MPQLLVRNLDADLVAGLRRRAARNGRSAEAEHREILKSALAPDEALDFKNFLLTMPDVGDDADFERHRDLPRDVEL